MQPTQHPLAGFAVIVLNEVRVQAGALLKVSLVEALKEKPPVITEDLGSRINTSGSAVEVTV